MFDAFSRWKRKLSSSASVSQTALIPSQQDDTESHRGSTGTGRGSRQFLSISQPIPRSSPSSLSGSIVRSGSGGAGEGGSIIYATSGIGNNSAGWEDQTLFGIEDNRPMGSLGRRRMGSVSSGSSGHDHAAGGGESEEPYLQGTQAPEVVRMDSIPPRHHSFEQQQQQYQPQHQQFHYPTHRGNLRLQTNVQPQHTPYNTYHQNQPFMHHYSHPPQPQQQQRRQPHTFQPPPQVKQLSPIAEASPTSTSADYQSLKKAGSEILAGSSSSPSPGGTSNNVRNSNATGGRRRSGSVGSGPSIHISAGSESHSGATTSASAGTGVSIIGSSRRQSGVSGTAFTGSSAGTGSGNGLLGVGGVGGSGNSGRLSPATPGTATTFREAGSPLSQYATPTTASASPDGPGFSPNVVVPPLSVGGLQGASASNAPVNASAGTTKSGAADISRPSPVYSSPFINRVLNRTASQTSSRGRSNSTSTIPGHITTSTSIAANLTPTASPVGAVHIGRQESLRSVTTSITRQEQQQQSQQQSHSRSGTPTLIGSSSGGGGTQSQNPLSSSTTIVVSSTEPPVIPPLNLSPPFPGPHPNVGPRVVKGRSRGRVMSGGSWSSWGSRGKGAGVGVGAMPKIPGSHEGHHDEYDDEGEYDDEEEYEDREEGEEYVDEEGYYHGEERYEEGVSAPGEEASGGYGYGWGYGYGFADEAGYAEQEEEQERISYGEKATVRYADQVKRDYVNDNAEAGPSGVTTQAGEFSGPLKQRQVDDGNNIHGDKPRLRPRVQEPRIPSSESFITRRWSRDRQRGIPTDSNGMRHSITNFFHLRAKNQRRWFGLANFTPAFWAFWLGFICPVLWLVGGWHFTSFGEQPPRMGVWEFYFSGRSPDGGLGWKEVFCCCLPGGRKRFIDVESGGGGVLGEEEKAADGIGGAGIGSDVKDKGKGKGVGSQGSRKKHHPERTVPRWISEKQSSDDGRARLNDPNHLKRSLKGISFGYPFIPRPANPPVSVTLGRARLWQRVLKIVGKPNRLLDQLYGIKLKEVRGRPESGRRMFDPWIQRCRYVFCYACALMAIGLCTASMYLIVFNTRQLR